jgi:hypothetical protein
MQPYTKTAAATRWINALPLDEENRKGKIEQFARQYGFKLSFYKQGLCAIFEKEPSANVGT